MVEGVVLAALAELGVTRAGAWVSYNWVHETLFDDPPALRSFIQRDVREKVARETGCDPALVAVIEMRHAYLVDVLERQRVRFAGLPLFPDEMVPGNIAVIVGVRPGWSS